MSTQAPLQGFRTVALERFSLDRNWTMVGVPPGSTDHRLAGLDGAMLPFTAPGTVAAALRAAGLWRPGSERRLDAEEWWFRCRFEAPVDEPGTETVLRLDGIASVADVWLNGEHVLSSRNMHLGHELPAEALRPGANELVIGVAALEPLLSERRPRPRWRTRLVETQNLRWFRTTLIGRLPSFAPEPAPVGPWRSTLLERRRLVAIDEIQVRATVDGADGIVRVRAALRGLGGFEPQAVTLRVDRSSATLEAPLELVSETGRAVANGSLRIEDADLWWPHTHGAPARYTAELVVEGGAGGSVVIDAGRVGFRTIEATTGPGLALAVNGVPVFCRGGSLLPDAVTLDPPEEALRERLVRARDAGMNMIRLSGVGTYGSEAFYELCDELGLLVWQDFAFANLDYPIEDDELRASVELEARQLLARAGSRPSLAVLCGNSEIEQQVGMLGLDPELGRGPLFGEMLPSLIAEKDVDAHYVPSTPTGGDLPFRPDTGVAHYFGVGAYRRPLEDARRADVRFASECLAIANIPDDATLETWRTGVPRDVGAGWDFGDVRDHYLSDLYGIDSVDLRSSDPDRYLALSQVVSGEVMAAVMGEWRRARSTCSGALVWTLNDPVPGAGWGILDVHGRPKAAYWYLKRALAPVAVWMTDEGTNGIAVHVANDTAEHLWTQLSVALYRPDGCPTNTAAVELGLAPHTTIERSVEGVLGRFADAGYAFRFGPPEHEVVVATLHEGPAIRSQAFHFTKGRPNGRSPFEELGMDGAFETADNDTVLLHLTTARLAHAVSLDVPGFVPDDDMFTLAPNHSRTIALRRRDETPWRGGGLRALNAHGRMSLPRE